MIHPVLKFLRCFDISRHVSCTTYRFRWGEVSVGPMRLGLEYSVYHENAHLMMAIPRLSVYLKAPMLLRQRPSTEDWNASFGFSATKESLQFHWRTACKVFFWPWEWKFVQNEIMDVNRRVILVDRAGDRMSFDVVQAAEAQASSSYPYTYTMRDGTVQHRTALVHVSRTTMKRKCFPFYKKRTTYIDVEFNDEVGERTGSWKGGCVGCSYTLHRDETPLQCLRRMESERVFD